MAFYKIPFRMGGGERIIYIKAKNSKEAKKMYKKITGEKKVRKGFGIYTTEVLEEEIKRMDLENILAKDFYWIVKI